LQLPLDGLVVRKIWHPLNREFAVGALAEPDVYLLDELCLSQIPVARAQLEKVVAEETARLRECRLRFRHVTAPSLNGKTVLLVDDGLATGTTAEAAVLSARRQNARRIIVAAPVASTRALENCNTRRMKSWRCRWILILALSGNTMKNLNRPRMTKWSHC
jgi:predicted phosphoribosyltransferase